MAPLKFPVPAGRSSSRSSIARAIASAARRCRRSPAVGRRTPRPPIRRPGSVPVCSARRRSRPRFGLDERVRRRRRSHRDAGLPEAAHRRHPLNTRLRDAVSGVDRALRRRSRRPPGPPPPTRPTLVLSPPVRYLLARSHESAAPTGAELSQTAYCLGIRGICLAENFVVPRTVVLRQQPLPGRELRWWRHRLDRRPGGPHPGPQQHGRRQDLVHQREVNAARMRRPDPDRPVTPLVPQPDAGTRHVRRYGTVVEPKAAVRREAAAYMASGVSVTAP